MIEVEIKLPLREKEPEAAVDKLLEWGYRKESDILEEDIYFDREDEMIRKGGQALRVRNVTDQMNASKVSLVTYKGPKLDQVSMTRRELETEAADGRILAQLLEAIGFHAVCPVVRKWRQEYKLDRITVCVDQVEGLGNFLEFEMVIREEENAETALARIENLLEQLGYSMEDTTRTSYLSLLQEQK